MEPQSKTKPWLASTTLWAIFLLTLQYGGTSLVHALEDDNKVSLQEGLEIVIAVATAAAGVVGRFNASSSLYTPSYLPGPDKPRENEIDPDYLR
jgi:hypothetical protein